MPAILNKVSENTATNSNTPIKKSKAVSEKFILFPESTLNFQHFEKKIEPRSLSVLQVIDCEKGGNFNAYEVLYQNILRQSTC